MNSGLINDYNLINDGIDMTTCKSDPVPSNNVFTYNQGIILAGLVELTWATGVASYTTLANEIAMAAIKNMTDSNGILRESCEPDACDGDEQQFKGVLARGIAFLFLRADGMATTEMEVYQQFLQTNANAIWADDSSDYNLGLVWSGPYQTADVQTQSSALDAIVGAACVT